MGNGAICQIPITIGYGGYSMGHMITAFQFRDKTFYFDPQLKSMNASQLFDYLLTTDLVSKLPVGYYYYRVDGVELSQEGRKMVRFIYDDI